MPQIGSDIVVVEAVEGLRKCPESTDAHLGRAFLFI